MSGCAGAEPPHLRVDRVTVRGALRSAGKRAKTERRREPRGVLAPRPRREAAGPAAPRDDPPILPTALSAGARPVPPEGSSAGAARRGRAEALGAAWVPTFPRVPCGLGDYLPFLNQNRSWEFFPVLAHFPHLIVFTEIRQHVRELQQGYQPYELKSKAP